LHTIEHFGLGRYGDPIDPDGHTKGLEQLKQMVKPGGVFYLSTPIGPERIEFNAHRVFAPETLMKWFETGWILEKCAVIDDHNQLTEGADTEVMKGFCGKLGVGIVAARKMK
jgi:SAM-dependent methyltransferase